MNNTNQLRSKEMKFKLDQKVKIIGSTYYPSDESRNKIGSCGHVGDIDLSDATYYVGDHWYNESDLAKIKETLYDAEPGDLIQGSYGTYARVFAVVGDLIAHSRRYNSKEEAARESSYVGWHSIPAYQHRWHMVEPGEAPLVEMTIEEIAKKLDMDASKLRIKDSE